MRRRPAFRTRKREGEEIVAEEREVKNVFSQSNDDGTRKKRSDTMTVILIKRTPGSEKE